MSVGSIIKYLIAAAALAVLGFYPKSFAATPEQTPAPAAASISLKN